MVFTSLACLQLFQTLGLRSERSSFFSLGLRTNPFLSFAVGITLLVQVGVLYWSPTRGILHLAALGWVDLVIVLAASTTVFWAVEAGKFFRRRREARLARAGD
jgi:Ca2+-transporting ATPase